MFGEDSIVKGHKRRADSLFQIILLAFGVILIRLWYLQIYQGDMLRRYSIQNRLRQEVVRAPRGMIFSRNNQLLVYNVPRFDAIIIPQFLSNKDQTIEKVSKILDLSLDEINDSLMKNRGQARYRPVIIKKNISRKELAIIETENSKIPGVFVDSFISREYSDKEIGGHLLGYISEISPSQLPKYRKRDNYDYRLGDFIGQSGLEEQFDLDLRGDDGVQFMEVDARGRMKRLVSSDNIFTGIENRAARPGNNIRLTIDRDLQFEAFKALEGKVGSVVAVDVRNGDILAMVSRPSFDPSQFSRGLSKEYWQTLTSDENNPLLDRAVQEHYSPGSTFKAVTAIVALEEKLIDADQEVMCKSTFRLGRRSYNDWLKGGHGLTNLYKALRRSVDVYFWKIGAQLDIDVLKRYAESLGLGEKTGIALPREISGLIPSKEWKLKRTGEEWQKGETLSCVIGQSYVLATPLQLAMAYSVIANEGTLYRPQLIKEIFSNSGEIIRKMKPEIVGGIKISPGNLKAVKKGLFEVVNHEKGTAYWTRGRGIRMAGKTGTTQVRSMNKKELFSKCKEMPYVDRHHGLFVGFAPFDNPQIAVAAIVEHGCSGSGAAAPVVRDVITKYMQKYEKDLYERYAEEDKREYKEILQRKLKEKMVMENEKVDPSLEMGATDAD